MRIKNLVAECDPESGNPAFWTCENEEGVHVLITAVAGDLEISAWEGWDIQGEWVLVHSDRYIPVGEIVPPTSEMLKLIGAEFVSE